MQSLHPSPNAIRRAVDAHGERMFAGDGAVAFGKPAFTPVRVGEIVARWLAVAERLDAAIPVHDNREAALAAVDASMQDTVVIEPWKHGWRLVRRPRAESLLSLRDC